MLNGRLLVLGMAALFGSVATPEAADKPSPTPEELSKITQAMPEKATAKPQKARKVLVFNLTRGFRHSSVPVAAKALEVMGQKTGAFEIVSSEDIGLFEPEKLGQFDAVVMNNTTGELFTKDTRNLSATEREAAQALEQRLKKSLLDFVRGGKGLVGLHAATDCFYRWKEYGEMMGGYFNGHPWGRVWVKIDDSKHPATAAFKGQGFDISDEIYTFKAPYSRENLRILASVDWPVSVEKLKLKNGNREDNDYALAWVRSYGQGRVFYSAFGHNHAIFWNTPLLQHMLDGIQFALGDLPGETQPSAKAGQ